MERKDTYMKTSEFKQKEVINIKTGKRLGAVVDFDIDSRSGRIVGILLPPAGKFTIFSKGEQDIFVPWENIRKIGDDVVLIDTPEQ